MTAAALAFTDHRGGYARVVFKNGTQLEGVLDTTAGRCYLHVRSDDLDGTAHSIALPLDPTGIAGILVAETQT